ncbi:hypothetical protein PGTUg99_037801 [Puccinia graminis f. sp. tritici]|uniref:Uncharacterized protein n=1 Tax=Puccinia graminis f. sp. tritici TaxID=56615 RepID=A0A5B0SNK4_PUCGR|nr:hypothetical protein PGTUg99_037801 [Puccinia graminis f. sp. tritici]
MFSRTALLDLARGPTPEFHCLPLNNCMRIVYKNVTDAQDSLEMLAQDALPPRFEDLERCLIQIEAALTRRAAAEQPPDVNTSEDVAATSTSPAVTRMQQRLSDALAPRQRPPILLTGINSDPIHTADPPPREPLACSSELELDPQPGSSEPLLHNPPHQSTTGSLQRETLSTRVKEVISQILDCVEPRGRNPHPDPWVNALSMESGSMQVNPKPASYHAANNSPRHMSITTSSKPTFLNRLDMFFFNFFTRSRSIPAPKQPGILVGPSSGSISNVIASSTPNPLGASAKGKGRPIAKLTVPPNNPTEIYSGSLKVDPDPVPSIHSVPVSAASSSPSSMQIEEPGESTLNDSDEITFLGINLSPDKLPLTHNRRSCCAASLSLQLSPFVDCVSISSSSKSKEHNFIFAEQTVPSMNPLVIQLGSLKEDPDPVPSNHSIPVAAASSDPSPMQIEQPGESALKESEKITFLGINLPPGSFPLAHKTRSRCFASVPPQALPCASSSKRSSSSEAGEGNSYKRLKF